MRVPFQPGQSLTSPAAARPTDISLSYLASRLRTAVSSGAYAVIASLSHRFNNRKTTLPIGLAVYGIASGRLTKSVCPAQMRIIFNALVSSSSLIAA